MAEEEKSGTEETTEAETQQTLALAEVLQELETTDDLRGKWTFLEGIVEDHGLDVKTNRGGHNSRTLNLRRSVFAAASH